MWLRVQSEKGKRMLVNTSNIDLVVESDDGKVCYLEKDGEIITYCTGSIEDFEKNLERERRRLDSQ